MVEYAEFVWKGFGNGEEAIMQTKLLCRQNHRKLIKIKHWVLTVAMFYVAYSNSNKAR